MNHLLKRRIRWFCIHNWKTIFVVFTFVTLAIASGVVIAQQNKRIQDLENSLNNHHDDHTTDNSNHTPSPSVNNDTKPSNLQNGANSGTKVSVHVISFAMKNYSI